MTLSDTPRVDAAKQHMTQLGNVGVDISFAKDLERENAALKEQIAVLQERVSELVNAGGTLMFSSDGGYTPLGQMLVDMEKRALAAEAQKQDGSP